jgi:hypothetical protein
MMKSKLEREKMERSQASDFSKTKKENLKKSHEIEREIEQIFTSKYPSV